MVLCICSLTALVFGRQSQRIVLLLGASVSLLPVLVLMLSPVMWLVVAASQA
jgi:hypothetical protein